MKTADKQDPDNKTLPGSSNSEPKAGSPAAKRKRTKRRKRKRVRDASGRLRPAFVLDFPKDPELSELVAAFERGDYELVRKEAPRVADFAEDPRVREAAQELRRRVDPDPAAKYFIALAVCLLLLLIIFAYQH